jgi:hypothetical protein
MSASAPFLQEIVGTGGGDSIDAEFTVARQQKIRRKVIRKIKQNFSANGVIIPCLSILTKSLKFKC